MTNKINPAMVLNIIKSRLSVNANLHQSIPVPEITASQSGNPGFDPNLCDWCHGFFLLSESSSVSPFKVTLHEYNRKVVDGPRVYGVKL